MTTDDSIFHPPQYAYDLLAEQALLRIALHGDELALQLTARLVSSFWDLRHKLLAAVLASMHGSGQQVDLVSVMGQVIARGHVTKIDGPWLHTVATGPGDHAGVVWYADRIRELAGRRRLMEVSARLTQRLEWGWSTGADLEVRTAITEFRSACDEVEESSRPDGLPGPQPMAEFLDGPMDFDWIIPGLLEHMERIIITGSEGHGKSVMLRQLAGCMAGSVHPFSGAVLGSGDRGIRVTVVDAENSAVQSRRGYKRIVGMVDTLRNRAGMSGADWKTQMAIDIRPEGIDLLKSKDVAWLEHIISVSSPDLLVLGPLYKLFVADPSDEPAVREVTAILDGLRARHGFALLMEAHSGKGTTQVGDRRMEPIGSSLWQRWPENGFGIRRAKEATGRRPEIVDTVEWRGSREERQWPEQLRHGRILPWEPVESMDQHERNDW